MLVCFHHAGKEETFLFYQNVAIHNNCLFYALIHDSPFSTYPSRRCMRNSALPEPVFLARGAGYELTQAK